MQRDMQGDILSAMSTNNVCVTHKIQIYQKPNRGFVAQTSDAVLSL